jgi:hypothetical protein
MSYTPTNWVTGDVITADKLNNMESGIAGAGRTFLVTVTVDENNKFTLNKTCGEIKAALMAGSLVCLELVLTQGEVVVYVQTLSQRFAFNEGGGCSIDFNGVALTALTDNDYPSNVSE